MALDQLIGSDSVRDHDLIAHILKKEKTMDISLSGQDLDDLLAALEGVEGVVVDRNNEKKTGKLFDRDLKAEPLTIAAATLIIGLKVLPKAIDAVRDIIVEYIRSRKVIIMIKDEVGSEISFSGPIKDENKLRALADAFPQRDSSEK